MFSRIMKRIAGAVFVSVGAVLAPAADAETIALQAPSTPITLVAGQTKTLNLDDLFTMARLTCELGTFDVQLYPLAAPQTTANFLKYADNGCYTNTIIHRSMPGFVVQGGGFIVTSSTANWLHTDSLGAYDNLRYTVQDWPIVNEPGLSNTAGTIAMAKSDGDPNSATNQWFINLTDNSSNLDSQNGGFTVFGKVLGGGMTVVNAIAAVPLRNESGRVSGFETLPVINYVDAANPGRLVAFTSVKRVTGMAYSPAAPTPTSAVVARISGSTLTLTPAAGAGDGTVTVAATVNGNTCEMAVPYHVAASAPAAFVPLRFFPAATGASAVSVSVYPGHSAAFNFSNYFSIVRFNSYKWGSFDLQLYPVHAPNATQNFLNYVNAGAYTNTIFETVDTFGTPPLAWGGRLKAPSTTLWPYSLALTSTNAPVADDAAATMPLNTRGTLFLMKKWDGTAQAFVPNSATNQWLINLGHDIAFVSRSYATFGEVVGSGMADVVDVMAAIPRGTLWLNSTHTDCDFSYNSTTPPYAATAPAGFPDAWFQNMPVSNYVSHSNFGTPVGFSSIARVTGFTYSAACQATGFTSSLSGQTLTITASATAGAGGCVQVNGTAGGKTYRLLVPVALNTAAPTVETPAAAAPAAVTGATTALSVLGAYGGGEDMLTYTWNVEAGAPGPVTFTPNGTNAAKACTAAFTKAGAYNLRVTIANTIGGTVTSTVAVTVGPTVATAAAAASTTVAGTGADLSVLGGNGNGSESDLVYTWDAGAGAPANVVFTPNGTNAAKITSARFARAGVYNLRVTIRNPATGFTAISTAAAVTVGQTLSSVAVSPEAAVLAPGGTRTFAAVACDQFGDAMAPQPASFAWSATGAGAIDPAGGAYTAGQIVENAAVSVSTGGVGGTARVFVTDSPGTAMLHLEPGWNLVCMPLEPAEQDAPALFGGAILPGAIWRWDAAKQRLVPAARLHALDAGWVYALAAADVTVTGAAPADTLRSLKAGWNLCGPTADLAPSLPAAVFWGWKPAAGFVRAAALKRGCGYWVLVPADTAWDAATGTAPAP